MKKRLTLIASTLVIAILPGTLTAGTTANAAPLDTGQQAPLVEDYAYPDAATIQSTYNVTLISGDGHLVFADCATPPEGNIGVLRVRTNNTSAGTGGRICFKILSTPAQLSLKVPAVYEIRGDGQVAGTGHQVQADLTTDAGQHSTVQVNPSGNTPVGAGAKPGDPPTTLLQLTASAPATAAKPAISGGSEAPDGAYPYVGRLDVGHPGAGGRSCSATLIDSSWILTATSCFADTGLQTGAPPQPTTVTLGRTATNPGRTAHVTYVTPKPGTNVSLGLLDASITDFTPPALSTTAPSPGETLTAVGYGRTADTWVPDQARVATATVNTTTDTTTTITGTGGLDTCLGDAGGPVLRQAGTGTELVALHSTSWQHGCIASHETRQGSTEARLDNITDWIRQQTTIATISIRNANGLCLDLGSNAPGTNVITITCQAGATSQQWRVLPDGTIRNANGLAMDISSNNPGELVVTAVVAAGIPSQQWQVPADGTIRNHNGLCADISANAVGTPVGTATCVPGNASQLWTASELHAVTGKIRNHNGLCADLTSNDLGTSMITAACQPAGWASQQWTAPIDGTIRNTNGLCLDLGSNTPGTPVATATCQAGGWTSQQWRVLPDGTIRNYNGLVMDIGTNAAGATVIIATTQPGNPSQQWTIGG